DDGASTYELADKYDTYPQKIRRLLKKQGKKLRDKSEAQSNAIKSGRHPHPTEGTTRSDETKLKISSSMVDYFYNISDEEKEKIVERAKERWDKMSQAEKDNFKNKGVQALRKARNEGSKLEKFVKEELTKLGYIVKYHDDNIIPGRDLQVDLSIPSKMVAIEIDGPSHFLPIWGVDKLRKQQKFDHDKNALIQNFGFTMIRVKCENHDLALIKKEDLIWQLDNAIK